MQHFSTAFRTVDVRDATKQMCDAQLSTAGEENAHEVTASVRSPHPLLANHQDVHWSILYAALL